MKIFFQVNEGGIETLDGISGEIAMAIVEHLVRVYNGIAPTGYISNLTKILDDLFKVQYNGSELLGTFGVGDDQLSYEIKIAEQHGDLQDLDFLVPWE